MSLPSPDWLARQRWFRSKQRPIDSLREVDRAVRPPLSLLVVDVRFADDGPPERYLLPTADGREPADGDGAWAALLDAIADGATIPGVRGAFACRRTDALAGLLPPSATERRLGVEQSNTSVVLGERLILKLYRLLEPGDNPDVEVSAFLTEAGFPDTPALAGSVTYRADGGHAAAAAMLQELVPAADDAWAAMLGALDAEPSRGVAMAGRIGDLTRRLHHALASRPDHPAFPARDATVAETAAWRASAERQLALAISSLHGADHSRLVELAPAARARFADAFGPAGGAPRISRIHGDYHLGQLLARPDGGFSVIDFEGEPARPLDERRRPASPLRDVAGMLRSLDYAARTAEARATAFDAGGWLDAARAAFMDGYGRIRPSDTPLLAALELEKACYEVRYEAGNRPAWRWLPLAAIERLVAAG